MLAARKVSAAFILIALGGTAVRLTHAFFRPVVIQSRISLPDESYDRLVSRIHSVHMIPSFWYMMHNSSSLKNEVNRGGYCAIEYDCSLRPQTLGELRPAKLRVYTKHRDESTLCFWPKVQVLQQPRPLVVLRLRARRRLGGGSCLDWKADLFDDDYPVGMGSWIATTLVIAARMAQPTPAVAADENGELEIQLLRGDDLYARVYRNWAKTKPPGAFARTPVMPRLI